MQYIEDPYLDRTSKLEDTLQKFMELTMDNQRNSNASLSNLKTQVGVITTHLSSLQVSQLEEPSPTKPFIIEPQLLTPKVEEFIELVLWSSTFVLGLARSELDQAHLAHAMR
ncbi:hypothetical protein Lal_00028356 [Lupinus albus]|nr:hypothetical protein Lal_00028356 [Lupinus albus]